MTIDGKFSKNNIHLCKKRFAIGSPEINNGWLTDYPFLQFTSASRQRPRKPTAAAAPKLSDQIQLVNSLISLVCLRSTFFPIPLSVEKIPQFFSSSVIHRVLVWNAARVFICADKMWDGMVPVRNAGILLTCVYACVCTYVCVNGLVMRETWKLWFGSLRLVALV